MDQNAVEGLLMPATYGRLLARVFEPAALLAGTGITPADLDDPELRITVAQAFGYVRNAHELATTPDWHLAWAGTLSSHFHGPISVALMSAPTLGDGLDVFVRHFPDRIPYLHLEARREDEDFVIELCPLIEFGTIAPIPVETLLIVLQDYIGTLYATDLAAARIELAYPEPEHAPSYPTYFKAPVRCSAPRHALIVPWRWRALGNINHIESTWAHAVRQCARTMGSTHERETLGALRRYLNRAFEEAAGERTLPRLEDAAAALHVSPRTLIRRLRRLGTSYQAEQDGFLGARARELLANDQLRVYEVAAALGFRNPANFGKAFKRWYGMPPGSYRRRHLR